MFDVRLQQWRHVAHVDNPNENDKVIARSLLEQIQKIMILAGDLGLLSDTPINSVTKGRMWLCNLKKRLEYTHN